MQFPCFVRRSNLPWYLRERKDGGFDGYFAIIISVTEERTPIGYPRPASGSRTYSWDTCRRRDSGNDPFVFERLYQGGKAMREKSRSRSLQNKLKRFAENIIFGNSLFLTRFCEKILVLRATWMSLSNSTRGKLWACCVLPGWRLSFRIFSKGRLI
jgi:hypothetical protein